MKQIQDDFKKLLTEQYLNDMAESHIECWKDRYWRKSKSDISFDLNVNHDNSLEIEQVETELGRELTDKENSRLITLFHSSILKNIYK